jgi:stage V sporulation protein K
LKRNDLIGKYVGHTAIKTREALMKGLNKVIFIDEAYELYNTAEHSSDSFGMECLNTILNFMNEYSDKCIIVFAGYKNLLHETIFRVQPGLERRIGWTYEIEDYKTEDLVNIYEKQLKEKSWFLINKDKIISLFKNNKELFKFGGGDTLRLCMYTKIVYSQVSFEKLINREEIDSFIGYDIVEKAVKMLKENHQNKKEELPYGMYS